jgi:hypothetical protein
MDQARSGIVDRFRKRHRSPAQFERGLRPSAFGVTTYTSCVPSGEKSNEVVGSTLIRFSGPTATPRLRSKPTVMDPANAIRREGDSIAAGKPHRGEIIVLAIRDAMDLTSGCRDNPNARTVCG